MTNYDLIHSDVIEWAKNYTGKPFHVLFADPPYHLVSIQKRFGKANSAPAKEGVYKRSSAGFMGSDWDSVDDSGMGIAFNPDTWATLSQHLYPGGFIMAFAGTRGYHRMAVAMEDANLIIHPAMIWVNLSGFPKATRIDTQIDKMAGNTRPQISDSFPFKRLLTFEGGGVLPAIAKAAQVQGTEVFFAIEPNVVTKNSINFIFKTYVGQPGQDVTNKVMFEEAANNLANASLEYDYSDEVNYVYATGQGEQASRTVEQVYDETRINQSIWGRIEGEADSRDQENTDGVNASGSMALWDGRPKIRFTGTPLDTEHLPFGTAWDFGYKVTTKFDVIQFDSIIRAVTLSLDSNGRKTIDTRLDFES